MHIRLASVLLLMVAVLQDASSTAPDSDHPSERAATQANERLIRKYIEAGKEGDQETLRTILADDVIMHFHGQNPLAGVIQGREQAWKKLGDVWGPLQLQFEIVKVEDLLVNRDRAVLLMRIQIKSPDETVESNRVDIYRIENNQIVELWVYDDDQYAIDALFATKEH